MCDMFEAQEQNEKNIPSTVAPCSTAAVTHRRPIHSRFLFFIIIIYTTHGGTKK